MDSKSYPGGRGSVKGKYINGVLTFNAGPLYPGVRHSKRVRATAAQVNAGLTVLPAIPGFKYRLIDAMMIAIGGAATTATSVDLLGTRAGSAVRPLVVAVAALTQSAVVRAGAANAVVLADGASFTALDANTAVSITKQSGGGNLGGASHVDVQVDYTIEPA